MQHGNHNDPVALGIKLSDKFPEVTSVNVNEQPRLIPEEARKQQFIHHGQPNLLPPRAKSVNALENTEGSDKSSGNGEGGPLYFELAEPGRLGDGVLLQDGTDKDKNITAADHKGGSPEERTKRFIDAFATLGVRPEAVAEATQIIKDGQLELNAVNQALKDGHDPSIVYRDLDQTVTWIKDTWNRPNGMGYLGLAMKNFDHFGADARLAYDAGHAYALSVAAKGDLNGAYALNAFADHFLEDSFSVGHIRVPHQFLHVGGDLDAGNLCAKYMHDEDSAIGLKVANAKGEEWTAYGDKRLLDRGR